MASNLSIAITFILAATSTAFGQTWKKIKEVDGIHIFERSDAGASSLDTVTIKAHGWVSARVKDVSDAMRNDLDKNWMPMVQSRTILKTLDGSERLERIVIDMPWPTTTRYFINRAKMTTTPEGKIQFHVRSVDNPDKSYLNEDWVLGIVHKSLIELSPDGVASTRVDLEVNTDPKGQIPKWLVNFGQRGWPVDFFTALKGRLREQGKLHNTLTSH